VSDTVARQFENFVVIDWSGDKSARQKGVAMAHAKPGSSAPSLLQPDGGWSRKGIADWFRQHADSGTDVLIGLDLSPGLPFDDADAYFPGWEASPPDAKSLWALIDSLSEADQNFFVSGFLSHDEARRYFRHQSDCGDRFGLGKGRLRKTEEHQAKMGLAPSSCFNLIGAAQVGKSSLTGMRVLHHLAGRIPVWPFDPLPAKGPVIVEIYTSLAARAAGLRRGISKLRDGASLDAALEVLGCLPHAPLSRYTDHATDAILTASWLRTVAHRIELWNPPELTPNIAATEGWTFGVI
jgi:hypothetical protein